MTNAVMKVSPAGLPATPSVLGTRRIALQTGGTIRPGIKVLTRAAEQNATARDIYDAGLAAGDSFDTIEKRIKEALPRLDNPMAPRNVPYFTVRRGDFIMPELAAQIMELYAEDRGDGVKRLYRFPIVFAADSLLDVMPHKLAVYTSSTIKFWSDMSADGERRCMTFAPVPKAPDGKAIRVFGGRKQVPRPDTDGRCDPEQCHEYQKRQCNVTGKLIFYVPGIASVTPLELPTHSIYGLDAIRDTLARVAEMRGGRISGFLMDREAFWLTKSLKEVPHIDEDGRAVRVKQWIFSLEVMVDLTRLLCAPEATIEAAGAAAADVLQGTAERVPDSDGWIEGFPGSTTGSQDFTEARPAAATGMADPPGMWGHDRATVGAAPAIAPDDGDGIEPNKARRSVERPPSSRQQERGAAPSDQVALGEIDEAAQQIGIDPTAFRQYADKRWGQGWAKNPNGRRKAIDELEASRTDPDALRQRIDAETKVFA